MYLFQSTQKKIKDIFSFNLNWFVLKFSDFVLKFLVSEDVMSNVYRIISSLALLILLIALSLLVLKLI